MSQAFTPYINLTSLIIKSRLASIALSFRIYVVHIVRFYKQKAHVCLPGWSSIYWGSCSPMADSVPCPSGYYVRRHRPRRPNERQWYWQNCTWNPRGRRFRYPAEKRASESSRGPSGSLLCVSISLGYLRKSWRGSGTCNHSSAAAGSAIYAKRYDQSRSLSQNGIYKYESVIFKSEHAHFFYGACSSSWLLLSLKYFFHVWIFRTIWNQFFFRVSLSKRYLFHVIS